MSKRAMALISVFGLFLASGAGATQKLYVLSSAADAVSVIDVATDRIVSSIRVGSHPHGIAAPASQDVLWVTAEEENQLVLVDLRKEEVVARFPVGGRPNEIDVTPDGRYVYVPALRDGKFEVFDTSSARSSRASPPMASRTTPSSRPTAVGSTSRRWIAAESRPTPSAYARWGCR